MPMLWRKTYSDEGLLLSDVHSAEHDAFDKAIHVKPLNFCILEQSLFNFISYHKCRSIQEEPEVVRTKGVTRHTFCLDVFQILYP